MQHRFDDAALATLARTAAAVRADPAAIRLTAPDPWWRRHLRGIGVGVAAAAAVAAGAAHLAATSTSVAADGGADSTLFSLTNQDRASNGVASVVWNGTLGAIGEGARYTGCGFTVYGRSDDMIQRNYFAHPIAGCGQLVFSIMHAYGINYQYAGENIGWVSGAGGGGSAASYINGQFMNSSDHRANILNSRYTDMGVGSDESAPGVTWTGVSPGQQNVWMFSEEFAQLHAAPAPRPTPRLTNPPRNSPGPPAPGQPPATAGPAATPTPIPTPTPTPIPASLLPAGAPAPLTYQYEGLLPSSIEAVLESFLFG